MREFGYLPSPDDERDWPLYKLGEVTLEALADRVDNDRFVEQIYNQTGNSCTGWGTARAWHVRARIQGDSSVHFPSADLIYAEGRIADTADPDAPLDDIGCYPRLTLLATKQLGVVPLDRWTRSPAGVMRPDWGTIRESADMRGVSFARVYGVDEMKRSIASGFPLVVGFRVDTSFIDYDGGIWDGMNGEYRGGHSTCLLSYDEESLRGPNSWGDEWGESGFYRISNRAAEGIEAWAVQLVGEAT